MNKIHKPIIVESSKYKEENFMKKILSLLLSLSILISGSLYCVFAVDTEDEGGITVGVIKDNMSADDINPYIVAFNDFSSTNKVAYNTHVKITNSGEAKYGNVLEILSYEDWERVEGANADGSSKQGTYTWNGKTYNTFNETLVAGGRYIFSYDYKCLTLNNSNPTKGAFSLAFKHDVFLIDSDYRHYAPHTTDMQWHQNSVAFVAEKAYADAKVLLCGTGVNSYIDNYCIQEAASIILQDGISLDIISGYTTSPVGHADELWTAKGGPLKFKVNFEKGTVADEVKVGNTVITPDKDGVYSIFSVSGDISVTSKPDLGPITSNYAIDENNNIYIPYQDTVYDITSLTGASAKTIKLESSQGELKFNDQYVAEGDKLSIVMNGEIAAEYTVKLTGNTNPEDDDVINVTDICNILKAAMNTPTGMPITYDIDGNGRITVTDVIRLRNKVLNLNTNVTADNSKVQQTDTYITNMLNSVTNFVPTRENLEAGIYNRGNRALLVKVMERAMNGETITIAGLGGSITQGAGYDQKPQVGIYKDKETGKDIGNYSLSTDMLDNCYLEIVCNWWKDTFDSVNYRNMGIGSTGSALGLYRLEDDVLVNNPDIVIVDYSVNDNNKTREWNKANYEAIVRRLLEKGIAVILIGFCTNSGTLDATCEEWHKPIADYYDVPFVSYRDAYAEIPLFNELSNDGTHPNIAGHALSGLLINNVLAETYANINTLTKVESKIPAEPLNPETFYDDGGYIANLSDIEDGKYKDIEMVQRGSFVRSNSLKVYASTSQNPNFRAYYGYVASPASTYKPMILNVKNAKTAMLLLQRWNTSLNSQFTVKVNGVKIEDSLFNTKDSHNYHWNSNRMFYYEDGKDVTIEILPTQIDSGKGPSQSENNSVTIYSLLLAHAE